MNEDEKKYKGKGRRLEGRREEDKRRLRLGEDDVRKIIKKNI